MCEPVIEVVKEPVIEEENDDDVCPPPYSIRTFLLAINRKRQRTRKFRPPDPLKFESVVRPSAIRGEAKENWRLGQLAIPKKPIKKYTPPPPRVDWSGISGIRPSALVATANDRTKDLATSVMRKLRERKRESLWLLGPKFGELMDMYLKRSWNSIYNYYIRMLPKKKQKKEKAKKLSPQEKKKKITAWLVKNANPKKVPKPRRPPRGPIANMAKIRRHMLFMSQPNYYTKKYLRPSIDPEYIDPQKVSEAAKKYEASERIREMAKMPPHRLKKDPIFIPGAVVQSALTCAVRPRFLELAVPKRKAAEKDSELKENPFGISPTALKYKPTARILELAKPIDRD